MNEDKLVARVLRESADCQDKAWEGVGNVGFSRYAMHCRKRADTLDPPEDRATRIAKRYGKEHIGVANGDWMGFKDLMRILREEGV